MHSEHMFIYALHIVSEWSLKINQNGFRSQTFVIEKSAIFSFTVVDEAYNDLKQELLSGLLKFDFKLLSSDHNIVCSFIITLTADLSSFKSDTSLSLWS
ncbi:hypothetical protein YC2023_013009 [Brassica napus]